jgi:NO-binding membrane sensor protein with MHYT domain
LGQVARVTTEQEEGAMSYKPGTLALLGVLIAVAAFGAGVWIGRDSGTHPAVYTGDGYVGADVATFQVGDTGYGFRSSVSWMDSAGSFHASGWPDCLVKLQAATGVRFAGATLWFGQVGISQVVWVDCQTQ